MRRLKRDIIVDIPESILLKNIGFDTIVQGIYVDDKYDECPIVSNIVLDNTRQRCQTAPNLGVVQRWLRDQRGIHVDVRTNIDPVNQKFTYSTIIYYPSKSHNNYQQYSEDNIGYRVFDDYDEALEYGMLIGIKLIKGFEGFDDYEKDWKNVKIKYNITI